jgi:SAM-dependent methyltransferase
MLNRVVFAVVLAAVTLVPERPKAQNPNDKNMWNATYSEKEKSGVALSPNAFLTKFVEGRKPGKALDIAMGQGRNAIMLAARGWDVTGFDISDTAIAQATREARRRGVTLSATVADLASHDYGSEQYDLIVATYANGFVSRTDDVIRALKPGGLLVVEGHHRDACYCGFDTNYLPREMANRLTILHYEDSVGRPDLTWTEPAADFRFVRLVGRRD